MCGACSAALSVWTVAASLLSIAGPTCRCWHVAKNDTAASAVGCKIMAVFASAVLSVLCVLQGPSLPHADVIIYCTGYRYSFPFLEQHPSTAHLSGQQHVPGL